MPPTDTSSASALEALCERAGVTLYVVRSEKGGGEPRIVFSCGAGRAADTDIATLIAAFAGDTDRATRHVAGTGWERLSVECASGTVGVARSPATGQLALVAAPDGASAALAERLAARAALLVDRGAM